jgi:hypothetical protein
MGIESEIEVYTGNMVTGIPSEIWLSVIFDDTISATRIGSRNGYRERHYRDPVGNLVIDNVCRQNFTIDWMAPDDRLDVPQRGIVKKEVVGNGRRRRRVQANDVRQRRQVERCRVERRRARVRREAGKVNVIGKDVGSIWCSTTMHSVRSIGKREVVGNSRRRRRVSMNVTVNGVG